MCSILLYTFNLVLYTIAPAVHRLLSTTILPLYTYKYLLVQLIHQTLPIWLCHLFHAMKYLLIQLLRISLSRPIIHLWHSMIPPLRIYLTNIHKCTLVEIFWYISIYILYLSPSRGAYLCLFVFFTFLFISLLALGNTPGEKPVERSTQLYICFGTCGFVPLIFTYGAWNNVLELPLYFPIN